MSITRYAADGTTVLGTYQTLHAAVAAAAAGDILYLPNDTYTLTSSLNITKGITIRGESEAGVIVNATTASAYGIRVIADNVTIEALTLQGPTASSGFGIKVEPDTAGRGDFVSNFNLTDVTVIGSGRTEIDLHGVNGANLTRVTATGEGTGGNGIALTDSMNVTLTDITTSGNGWGSVALYSANRFYDQASGNIIFAGTYDAAEAQKVYAQDSSASQNLGSVTLPYSDVWTVTNDTHRGATSDQFKYYFGSEAEALAFALALPSGDTQSVIREPDGDFFVGAGMSIQEALDKASDGDTIVIAAGTYDDSHWPLRHQRFGQGDV
jgi:hypothetical protein